MELGLNAEATAAASGEPTARLDPRFTPPSIEALAGKFSGYEVLELVGQGGMGAVYKAKQSDLNREVAIKILPLEIADEQGFSARFTREAQSLAKLNHPNIVTVFDFGRLEGLFYFVMEYVDGLTLRELLADGKLSPPHALKIIQQICEALQYAHDEGVVHRDIKPENVLIDRRGRVKIADFGLAKFVGSRDDTITGTGHVLGTPHYMAPEQVHGNPNIDHRADIYSLGVVFYEVLTGELPLGRWEPPSSHADVDLRLDEVVSRSLEKEPRRRYQHASEVRLDVDSIVDNEAPEFSPTRDGRRTSTQARGPSMNEPRKSISPWLVTLLLLFVGCIGIPLVGGVVMLLAYKSAEQPAKVPHHPGSDLAPRVEAARNIRDPSARRAALLQLAEEASKAANAAGVEICLSLVRDAPEHDSTARRCALNLAKLGDHRTAMATVRLIMDYALQDQVYDEIARGDFSSLEHRSSAPGETTEVFRVGTRALDVSFEGASYPAAAVALDEGNALFVDPTAEEHLLDADFWFEPRDPEVRALNGSTDDFRVPDGVDCRVAVNRSELGYDEIGAVPQLLVWQHALPRDAIREGLTFFLRARKGSIYKVRIDAMSDNGFRISYSELGAVVE